MFDLNDIVFEHVLSLTFSDLVLFKLSRAVHLQPLEITVFQQYFKSSLQGSYLTLMQSHAGWFLLKKKIAEERILKA